MGRHYRFELRRPLACLPLHCMSPGRETGSRVGCRGHSGRWELEALEALVQSRRTRCWDESRAILYGCNSGRRHVDRSNIPPDRSFVGRAQYMPRPGQFDFIFSLGVTSYQTPQEPASTWRFISERLAPGGTAVISFTNAGSIEHALRKALEIAKPLVRRGVFGGRFAPAPPCVRAPLVYFIPDARQIPFYEVASYLRYQYPY